MSPAEYIELLQNGGLNVSTHAMNYVALLFAYIVATYVVGSKLNRFQSWAISLLYSLFALLPAQAAVSAYEQALALARMFFRDHPAVATEYFNNASFPAALNPTYLGVVFLAAWGMSIAFMVSERMNSGRGT